MRTIKFRVWDLNEKYWLKEKETSIHFNNANSLFNVSQPFVRFNRGDMILCQFTGLFDKNGKEIYEGDIVNGVVIVDGDEIYHRHGGNRSTKKSMMVKCFIEYDITKAKFICKCYNKNTYRTSFYRGCGCTRTEKQTNEYRQITTAINIEIEQLYKNKFEVIGNIYENAELLKIE